MLKFIIAICTLTLKSHGLTRCVEQRQQQQQQQQQQQHVTTFSI